MRKLNRSIQMDKLVDKLKQGMYEAIIGIVAGYMVTVMLDTFVEDGLIPWWIRALFVIGGAIGSWGLIEKLKLKVVPYIIGWVIGAWLLRDLISTADILIYIVVPVLIIVLKVWTTIKR